MLPYPDLSGFSEEERMQLMTVMKKAQVECNGWQVSGANLTGNYRRKVRIYIDFE